MPEPVDLPGFPGFPCTFFLRSLLFWNSHRYKLGDSRIMQQIILMQATITDEGNIIWYLDVHVVYGTQGANGH